jgi:hypothetical protein
VTEALTCLAVGGEHKRDSLGWTPLRLVIAQYAPGSIAWLYGGFPKVVELGFGPRANTRVRRLDVVALTLTPA